MKNAKIAEKIIPQSADMPNSIKFCFVILFLLCPLPALSTQWPEIKLLKIPKYELPVAVQVTIAKDPVYKTRKKYLAYPLDEFLGLLKPPKQIGPEELLVIFTAEDGYQSFMSYSDAISESGYIAFKDVAASAKNHWQPFKFGAKMTTPEPYYLVWPNPELDKWLFPWPFKLTRISFEPAVDFFAAALPKTDQKPVQQGFELFTQYCIRCHSVNNVGGKIGPEILVSDPRNKYLVEFILDAPSFIKDTKMPSFKDRLETKNALAILAYLKYIHSK